MHTHELDFGVFWMASYYPLNHRIFQWIISFLVYHGTLCIPLLFFSAINLTGLFSSTLLDVFILPFLSLLPIVPQQREVVRHVVKHHSTLLYSHC